MTRPDPIQLAGASDPGALLDEEARSHETSDAPDMRPPSGTALQSEANAAAKAALFQQLAENPFRFDFYQAVRRLECAAANQPRIGQSQRVEQDAVRFAQEPSLTFAPSSVAGFDAGDAGRSPRLTVNFFGMLGPNGPMPLHLTEYARDRQRNSADRTLSRFLDIFHHRMTSLFYRAWACNQQTVSADRAGADRTGLSRGTDAAMNDRFGVYIASTIGRGMPSMWGRDAVPDQAKLHYAGRLAAQTAHAEGLEAILADYFDVPARVEPFVGRWVDLPTENHCRLGRSRETGTLGESAIVGSQIWDCQSKFRVRLGPMSFENFARLLPDQPGNRQLRAWVRNYVGDTLAWEARLVLGRAQVPQVRLGRLGQLGWSTWLSSAAVARDAEDLLLCGDA